MTAATNAERQRAYRVRNGAGDKPGRPVSAHCPSLAAHRRHLRHSEPPCDGCRDVYNAEQRRLYAARKARQ